MALHSVQYNNLVFRIIAAIFGSFFIIFFGRWGSITSDFQKLGFYITFSFSCLLTFSLLFVIHRGTMYLDKHYDWRERLWDRVTMQFIVGVMIASLVDLIFVSIHLSFWGETIFSTGFLQIDFWVVVGFLVLINCYYAVHYLIVSNPVPREIEPLIIEHNGTLVNLNVTQEVAYFYKQDKLTKVVCSTGEVYNTKDSLQNLQERFEPENFCRINKSVIVNASMLRGYQGVVNERSWLVLFKPEIIPHVEGTADLFLVNRANIGVLKRLITKEQKHQLA